MLRKVLAALLLTLATSPFTAPFATCDIDTLLGRHPAIGDSQVTLDSVLEQDAPADPAAGKVRRAGLSHRDMAIGHTAATARRHLPVATRAHYVAASPAPAQSRPITRLRI